MPGVAPARSRRKLVRFRHALTWLLVGSLFYGVVLAVVLLLYPDPQDALAPVIGPNCYLTPLFGLPYLIASARQRGWLKRVLYFTILLTACHMVANYLAWRFGVANYQVEPDGREYLRHLATGAIGGLAGSTLAFAALLGMRMAPWTTASRSLVVVAILSLTAVGALGMAQGLAWSHALDLEIRPSRFVTWYECVHLPWQAAFALFLAWLMRLRPATGGVQAGR